MSMASTPPSRLTNRVLSEIATHPRLSGSGVEVTIVGALGREIIENNQETAVIIITGYVDTAENSHKKGDFIYIFKPIDIPYLLKVLRDKTVKSDN